MDVDAFSQARAGRWARLKELSGQRRLTGAEADELTRLYQSTAGDLAAVRSAAPDPAVVSRLSMLLASARVWLTGGHESSTRSIRHFVLLSLPAALYRVRWWGVAVTFVVIIGGALSAWYLLTHPEAMDALASPAERAQYASYEFANYYVEYDSTSFAARVWTNNWFIAAQCIALGITGIYPAFLMFNTILQLGTAAAIMAEAGYFSIFLQLISPHGLLELSAVFVAAGAGLRLFWTLLSPGPRTRGTALAQEGRTAFGVAVGLAVVLLISGLIEGYITGSGLPWSVKVVIGVIAVAAFWIYIFVVGRYATALNATGDVDGDFATAKVQVAA
ncbi:stage II sporulation protein M [Demequina globuliformis]|uniref:stage II sporulation protein M n=1 Tax=Demequina globuliformis TaxID=676202 RepID=UPI000784497C|nr:stage II sporulation protein M [Demequina globuliformis]